MELHEKIARGLRRRQIMPEQQGQRLVLAKRVEVFRLLTPAAHSANRLSAISAALRPRLRLFNWISRSITVEAARDALLAVEQTAKPGPAAMLLDIRGIGPEFAAILWSEGLFRHFENRRHIAAYAGLAPTPWQSGAVDREQGVSKAGNPRLRTTLIQLAWLWLRNQPRSALSVWFHKRVSRNGGRLRKTTIVALARKLLVALWKYVTAGVVIEGVTMKVA